MEEKERELERIAKGPSRPGSAIVDSTGRKVVYGKSSFHAAVQTQREKERSKTRNEYDGAMYQGLPDGFGSKVYTTHKEWSGRLLPFGCIMREPFTPDTGIEGSVIEFWRFKAQTGLLSKFENPIMLVEGKDTVKSVLQCAKTLERLRYANYKLRAAIITFSSEQVFQEVASQAVYSAMLQFFSFPVIATIASEFQFDPLDWPDEEHICGLLPEIQQEFELEHHAETWHVHHRANFPPHLNIQAEGKHALTLQGTFPMQPIGSLKVNLAWTGKEVYVGNFKEGAKHGPGIFLRSSGDKFVGEFKGGVSHGKGRYYWKNGDVCLGTWHHGKLLGRGEMRTWKMQLAATSLQCNFRMWMARRMAEHLQFAKESKKRAESRATSRGEALSPIQSPTTPYDPTGLLVSGQQRYFANSDDETEV